MKQSTNNPASLLRSLAVPGVALALVACGPDTAPEESPQTSASALLTDADGTLRPDLGGPTLFNDVWTSVRDATGHVCVDYNNDSDPGTVTLPVPNRFAGPLAEAAPTPRPLRMQPGPLADFSPLDAPLTERLDEETAQRQRVFSSAEAAAHPDFGFRSPGDPVGSFEVLDLRTEDTRTLQFPDGGRALVSFPAPAFAPDADGVLRNNRFHFEEYRNRTLMRSQAGVATTLPTSMANGLDIEVHAASGDTAVRVLEGLGARAVGNDTLSLPMPTGAFENEGAFAHVWSDAIDAGLRLDGLHAGFQWSMTLGEQWVANIPQGTQALEFHYTTTLDPEWAVTVDGDEVDAIETCETIAILDATGAPVYAIGAPRVWDAADAANGQSEPNCGTDVVTRAVRTDDGLDVTVRVAADWALSSERTFPLVIDPEFTFNFTGSQDYFGTVFGGALSGVNPRRGRAEWGDYDDRRGFFVWSINGIPNDAWALNSNRIITVEGHSNGSSWDYNMASMTDMRWVNYQEGSNWVQAYNATNTTEGANLFGDFYSDYWHQEFLDTPAPPVATWDTLCTGTACMSGVEMETEANDTFATADAANLGSQTGDTVFGGTLTPNDIDFFGMITTYEPTFRVTVESADGGPCTLDGVLELRLGDEVILSDDGVCPSVDTCDVPAGWTCHLLGEGSYGISFRGYAPFDIGDYRIRVESAVNPDGFNGLRRARWNLNTSFGDNPVHVFTENHNRTFINEMWRNTTRTSSDWFGVVRQSDSTTYPTFILEYAQPVHDPPGNFSWETRTVDTIRWEWEHALNARWYTLYDGSGSVVANNLYRYRFDSATGEYIYYVDEAGLTENACTVRAAGGANQIGGGPISPTDQVATLARNPIVPSAATAPDGDFVVSGTTFNTVTIDYTYALPSVTEPNGCHLASNYSAYEARLASCATGNVIAGSYASSTADTLTMNSTESCVHIEIRYTNMDNVPTSWVRTGFQVNLDPGLIAPDNFDAVDRDVQSITWGWEDSTTVETGFIVSDASGVDRNTTPSTTGPGHGSSYSWEETFTSNPDGNIPHTRRVRSTDGTSSSANSPNATAYTLPRQTVFDSGTDYTWGGSDAIVYNLTPSGGGYQATVVVAAQPNNATTGCSGAELTRCRMDGGTPVECVVVSAGTQGDAAANGNCDSPVADGQFNDRGYGDRYDGGVVVAGDGLFAGRPEGVVQDPGLAAGETYRYTVRYVNGDDYAGEPSSFDVTVACCFDPDSPSTGYHGGGTCDGVCGGAVPGVLLWCQPPDGYEADETTCDELDNDCDGEVDEGAPEWYLDADNDGYGDPSTATAACGPPTPDHVATPGDCDDADPLVNPGAAELCDGVDNDCNPATGDGAADGGVGAACGTGLPGECGVGSASCGLAGSASHSFGSTPSGWSQVRGSASWTAGGGSWTATSTGGGTVQSTTTSFVDNSAHVDFDMTLVGSGEAGFAWDIVDGDNFAFVVVDSGGSPTPGNERVRVGRYVAGAETGVVNMPGVVASSGDDLRLWVQIHHDSVTVWYSNLSTGAGPVELGTTTVGALNSSNVGLYVLNSDGTSFSALSYDAAAMQCNAPSPTAETCDGLDNDCDGVVDNGFSLGGSCDGDDADLCLDGTYVCNAVGDGVECADRSPSIIWNFDEMSGVSAYDASGSGNVGTVAGGAAWTASSRYGSGALELDGNNGYVTLPLDVDEETFTLAAWFRTTDTDGGIFTVTAGDAFGSGGHDRDLYVRNGYLAYDVWNGPTSQCENVGPRVDDNAWHHGVITCTIGDACRLYLDGVELCASSDAASSYSQFAAQTNFTVGHSAIVGRFTGQVDHVNVLSWGMNAGEVATLYADGLFTRDVGANAEVCDGVDNDCDGNIEDATLTEYHPDADDDTYGDPDISQMLCADDPSVIDGSWVEDDTDCDDADAATNPGATEIVGDEKDQTCDDIEICYVDADGDTARVNTVVLSTDDVLCSTGDNEARYDAPLDCDDANPAIYPGAPELCNGIDDDCDLAIDEGFATAAWYADTDFDGYGDPTASVNACAAPNGYVSNGDDCADFDPSIYPGAPELCDGIDNDCDLTILDEGEDLDGDGASTCDGDCDDSDPNANLDDADGDNYDTCGSLIVGGNVEFDFVENGVIGDTFLREPGTTHGTEIAMGVGNGSSTGPARSVVQFDLTGVPAGATIVRAEAFMYAYSRWDSNPGTTTPVDRSIAAHRLLEDWTETSATSTNTGVGGSTWGTPLVGLDDVDAEAAQQSARLVSSGNTSFPAGWVRWDVTEAVNAWADGAPNYGLVFHALNQGTDGFEVRFFTKEHADPTLRPYIRIYYSGDSSLVDCNDSIAAVNPGATEACDGQDTDCDGDIDDADLDFPDADGDSYRVCDCDDTDPRTYLGAPEVCDYKDNDCDPATPIDAPFNVGDACDAAGDVDSCMDGVITCSNDLTTGVCSDGAAAVYTFEEGSSAAAYDWSGDGADGTLQGGLTYGLARFGGHGVTFAPGTAAVRIPGAEATGLEFTVGGWFHPTVTGDRFIISRSGDVGANSIAFGINGQLWYGNVQMDDAALALPQGTWTHVAITFDRRELRVYLNGTLEKTVTVPLGAQVGAWNSDVWFGQDLDGPDSGISSSQSFGGHADDLVWYGHALDGVGVQALAAATPMSDINAEICDGADNNCNGDIDEGFTVGQTCDGDDPDACNDGLQLCTADRLDTYCGGGAGALLSFEADPANGMFDVSGSLNHGTRDPSVIQAFVAGRQALILPGSTTGTVQIPNAAADSAQFTFAGHFYPITGGADETLVSVASNYSDGCDADGFAIRADGTITFNCDEFDTGVPFGTNAWSHVAVTFDGETMEVYRNGLAVPVATWTPCTSSGPGDTVIDNCDYKMRSTQWTSDIWIGQDQDSVNGGFEPSEAFNGYIDEIAWFNYALDSSAASGLGAGFAAGDVNHEFCDGLDNNCLAGPDEPFVADLGDSCVSGLGECGMPGTYVCDPTQYEVMCDATPGSPTPEVCDNLDNDCDGSIDEDTDGTPLAQACYTGPAGTENVGECEGGVSECVAGIWRACGGQTLPQPETCDGLDNNCDGVTDRDSSGDFIEEPCYSGPAGTEDVGLCTGGNRVCTASGTWGTCAGEVTPVAEICDNEDNDCNGDVDNFTESCYSGPAGTAGVGACTEGDRLCTAGTWGTCSGSVTPEAEICSVSGTDDLNCDGEVDDFCLEPIIEILGFVTGDPDADYSVCDQTDGSPTVCTILTVRVTNVGTRPLPAGMELHAYVDDGGTRTHLSGPFVLPSTLAPAPSPTVDGGTVEIDYCFQSDIGRVSTDLVVQMPLEHGGHAEDVLAGQSVAACGDEICDGYDNDGDGDVDEYPEACGATRICIYSTTQSRYMCVATQSEEAACADEGCGDECAEDDQCGDGEFCSDGACVHSGRWEEEDREAAPVTEETTETDAAADSAETPGSAGCATSAPRGGAPWLLAFGALGFLVRRRR